MKIFTKSFLLAVSLLLTVNLNAQEQATIKDYMKKEDQQKVDELLSKMREIESKKIKKQEVANKGFTETDMLITVVMPGGILYSLVKKGQIHEAEKEAKKLGIELNEVKDLIVQHVKLKKETELLLRETALNGNTISTYNEKMGNFPKEKLIN